MKTEILAGTFSLLGVVIGFGLSELTQYLKYRIKRGNLRSSLDAELKAIIRMAPNKENILSQAIEKFSKGHVMHTSSTHFPYQVYNQIIENASELLSQPERDCLHIAYERLRVIDTEMDAMVELFNSITAAHSSTHSSTHASQAVTGMLSDMKDSLPITVELVRSVLEKQPTDVYDAPNGT